MADERAGARAAGLQVADDSTRLEELGYKQELRRVLSLFENFGIAFCYISPVVGIYSLFVLGLGSGGPRYLWLMPIVVGGQLLVALTFAELGSTFPLAGALFQWAKNLVGEAYGWFVGWAYGWALVITIAAVDTGVVIYAATLSNKYLHTHFDPVNANTILLFTLAMLALQTLFNVIGVQKAAFIVKIGVISEVVATIGIAVMLAIAGFHHGFGYLFTTQDVQHAAGNPFGVDFGGNWWLGAALVAILAHVYIFYGFESAGDVAEEVVEASRQVPKAMVTSLLVGGITSFVLVAGLILAIPAGHAAFAKAGSFAGGIPFILDANVHVGWIQDIILAFVVFAFFSCGTAIQAAAARLIYSYSRDGALPGSRILRKVSVQFKTPVAALLVAAVIPALFSLLVHFTPTHPIHIGFITYPANVNALFILVSFGVSGIYLSFMMVVFAVLVARSRGWRSSGFSLGRWALPVYLGAATYGTLMFINIVFPTGVDSPKGALFNYDWMTLAVLLGIMILGAIYFAIARPDRRIAGRTLDESPEPEALAI
ncbi:MAG: amino acid permease [Actinomycetota bacterium]|nr:amino acid permease [Actinomycetota bacterium]